MLARRIVPRWTTILHNSNPSAFVRHQSTARRRSGQNLSARFAPQSQPTSSPILNTSNPDVHENAIKALRTGLSPEGMSNPKTVEAAARLSSHSTGDPARRDSNVLNVGGVNIRMPEKPSPPGPEDCCMSGCAVCVHDLYVEALRDYKASLRSIRDNLETKVVRQSLWPKEIIELSPNTEAQEDDVDDADLDPATKAFMQMERELKKKHEQQQKQQIA
ncbi:hypothetical protein FRB90_007235 [Tulasnella sp. 427]|nr:hypothetical protein FRB90_007235 [Tulasnella sp. 427]